MPLPGDTCGVTLGITWVQQHPGLCGPACATMILDARGIHVPLPRLWADVKDNTPGPAGPPNPGTLCGQFPTQICEACGTASFCWCSHPSALVQTLNQHLQQKDYLEHVVSSEADVTARAVASIDSGVAPVVLVYGLMHWVVMYGYRCDGTKGLNVTHVLIHDPADPPGIGEMLTDGVPVSDWRADYLEQGECGRYLASWVVLGAGYSAPALKLSHATRENQPMDVLQPDVVLERARIEARRLLSTERWGVALKEARPGTPVLVRRLDGGSPYYIVPFERTDGLPTARLLFNGATGEAGQAWGIRDPGANMPPWPSSAELLRRLNGRELAVQGRMMRLETARLRVVDTLVWKPCDQSYTKLLPFHELQQGDETLYLRVDGELFPELTRLSAGA
jgi:hypothetical protein